MRHCTIRHQADIDLDEIADYIGARNSTAGERFLLAVENDFTLLLEFPGVGTRKRVRSKKFSKLMFWPVTGFRNFLIFYISDKNGIDVIRVLHGARRIRAALFD